MAVICPASEEWAAWASGEVTVERHRRLTEHAVSCRRCALEAERLRTLTAELRCIALAPAAPGFTAAVLSKLHTPRRPRWQLTAAGAACVVLLGLVLVRQDTQTGFAARGAGAARGSRVGCEVYVHEPGHAALRLQAGQRVKSEAGYSFVISNRSQEQQHLMLFALDARAELHWFYPAFEAPDHDPSSVVVPATPQVQALPEGVTPEDPAPGPIQFVALFSPTALRVSEVEARVKAGGLSALTSVHAGVQLQVLPAVLSAEVNTR